jgi:ribulose kinase
LIIPKTGEAVALGTAMLAGVAKGVFKSFEEAIDAMVSFEDSIQPNNSYLQNYNNRYQIYQLIYKDLLKVNRMISDLTREEQ